MDRLYGEMGSIVAGRLFALLVSAPVVLRSQHHLFQPPLPHLGIWLVEHDIVPLPEDTVSMPILATKKTRIGELSYWHRGKALLVASSSII